MNLHYYIIRGRGDNGLKFQLAKVEDDHGNTFKGLYDMGHQFSSLDEVKDHLAPIVGAAAGDISLTEMII
ncbi:MAG: hypothetical protein AAGF06_03750 [Pseudomonadota bacterium]